MTVRMAELSEQRVPFVHATVVRAEQPTSARPGDDAIILADGTMEGFVGGQCAEESVRAAALGALERGESLLLRVLPGGEGSFPDAPGALRDREPVLVRRRIGDLLGAPGAARRHQHRRHLTDRQRRRRPRRSRSASRSRARAPDASQQGAVATDHLQPRP